MKESTREALDLNANPSATIVLPLEVHTSDTYFIETLLLELDQHIVSAFSPRGVTPTSKFVCVLPFPDRDARRHRDLSWFGQEKALLPARGEKFVLSCT